MAVKRKATPASGDDLTWAGPAPQAGVHFLGFLFVEIRITTFPQARGWPVWPDTAARKGNGIGHSATTSIVPGVNVTPWNAG
jgi:hypothetical protein